MTNEEYLEILNNTEEEWRQLIFNHELLNYDVSNIGRIRKHDTQKILKPSYKKGMTNCYGQIQIKLGNDKKINTEIHRLIAFMFIPIPTHYIEEGYSQSTLHIDHVDGVKYHNIVENLEWVTPAENLQRAINNGLCNFKLISKETAEDICKLLELGYPINIIASDLNVSESVVHSIRYGTTWTEVSKKYTFPSNRYSITTVHLICEYIAKGYSNIQIAKLLSVSESQIQKIRKRQVWFEISKDYEFPVKKIDRETAIQICEMLQEGMKPKTIAEVIGVGKRTVEHIRDRSSWAEVSKDYIFEYEKFKVPDAIVHNICKELEEGVKYMKCIAEDNGVSLTFVKDIKYGKCRTDISKYYKIGLSS